jgi:acetyl esterase/lipase
MKGVWIQPVPHLILGPIKEWASNAGVSSVRIPGYWIDKPGFDTSPDAPASPGERVILKFHGGGYISKSAYPADRTCNTVKGVLGCTTSIRRAFSVEYRLSVGRPFEPENPFPAALLDALAAYDHLLNTLGFESENIIVEGDSAGGNLALAFVKYLLEYRDALAEAAPPGKKALTAPSGVILCSPWVDLGSSHDQPVRSYLARSDYIENERGPRSRYPQQAFVGPLGMPAANTNAFISPASKAIPKVSFAGWPRTLIICGGAENFAPSIRTLKERMAADMGEGSGTGQVSYCEAIDGIHDFLMFPWHEPERSQILTAMADWVDQ